MKKAGIWMLLCLLCLCAACQRTAPPGPEIPPPSPGASSQLPPDPVPVQNPEPIQSPEPPQSPEPVQSPEPAQDPEPVQNPDPPQNPEAAQNPEPVSDPAPKPPASNHRLYVLMYHHFVQEGKKCNNWMLTDTRLAEDLQWLADHGYTTVLPSQLAAGEPLPDRAVMLTFDDGYASNYLLAYPLLQQFQAKAVISLVVQYVQEEYAGFLTWDMCREMAGSGLVEFGSHTYASHDGNENGIKRLKGESRADYEARILPDLQASIDLMEENLGTPPLLFAYPNGVKESWAAGFIQEHFAITLTTRSGRTDISKGLYSMRRYNVSMGVPLSKILPD